MSYAFHLLCPRYSWTVTPTAPMENLYDIIRKGQSHKKHLPNNIKVHTHTHLKVLRRQGTLLVLDR